jgi:hypothetical protein
LVSVGDHDAYFEVVHDARLGVVTVFARERVGQPLKLDSEPVLVVTTTDGSRALTLARVSGSLNSWKVTDAALKTESLAGSLKVRIGSKDLLGTLAVSGDAAEPMIPARREERFEPTHGGRVVMLAGKPFEWAHDSKAGTLTLFVVAEKDTKAAPAVTEPSAILMGDFGQKELALTAVADAPNTWSVTDPVLKSALLEGVLRVTLDGKPTEAAIVPRGDHGGRILRLGPDAPFLEMKHDTEAGSVTLYFVAPKSETYADSSATLAESPVLDLETASGTKSVTFTRVEGQANAWTATDDAFKARGLKGTVRVKIGDKSFSAVIAPRAKGGMKKASGTDGAR